MNLMKSVSLEDASPLGKIERFGPPWQPTVSRKRASRDSANKKVFAVYQAESSRIEILRTTEFGEETAEGKSRYDSRNLEEQHSICSSELDLTGELFQEWTDQASN